MANRYDAEQDLEARLPEEAPVSPQDAAEEANQANLQATIHLLNNPSKSSIGSGGGTLEGMHQAYQN